MSLKMSHEFLISHTSSQGSFIFYELRGGGRPKGNMACKGVAPASVIVQIFLPESAKIASLRF